MLPVSRDQHDRRVVHRHDSDRNGSGVAFTATVSVHASIAHEQLESVRPSDDAVCICGRVVAQASQGAVQRRDAPLELKERGPRRSATEERNADEARCGVGEAQNAVPDAESDAKGCANARRHRASIREDGINVEEREAVERQVRVLIDNL